MKKLYCISPTTLLTITLFLFVQMSSLIAQTPVQKYGQLKVTGSQITDQLGNPVALRGVSNFWSNSNEGATFFDAATVKWLRDDWCIDVIRAVMGVEDLGGQQGYLNNAAGEKAKIVRVIDAAIANGIYVIVDFHSHNAETASQKAAAKTFFKEIAQAYGDKPNVLYETFNEPINQSWSTLRAYHNEVVSYIRQYDADNIIICGTRSYSREVEEAADNKVTGTNIAYTAHFYAGGGTDHNNDLRIKINNAMTKGAAIFVTEYGTCDPSGNGGYNAGNTQTWWDYLDQKKIGACNWAISNKNETASILTSGTTAKSNWSGGQITTSGALVKAYLKNKCSSSSVSGTITLTAPNANAQFNAGQVVTISATTTVSVGGTISKVEFYDGDILLNSDTQAPYSYSTSLLSGGAHTIKAVSYDQFGNAVATSSNIIITVIGASQISTKGATDMFETTEQLAVLTGGKDCAAPKAATYAGIFWWEDKLVSTPFKAEKTRAGDGKLIYTMSQAANKYEAIGLGFGAHCNSTRVPYTLDLSQNAVMKMNVSAPSTNTVNLEIKIQLKDADGTILAFNSAVVDGSIIRNTWATGAYYRYEIGFNTNHVSVQGQSPVHTDEQVGPGPLKPNTSVNFEFDFKNAVTISNTTYPAGIDLNNSKFDYTKVSEVVIIVVNSAQNAQYQPMAFTDQQVIFSGFQFGDVNSGVAICTPIVPVTTASASLCEGVSGALSATALTGLNLKWYGTASSGGTGSSTATIPSTDNLGTTNYYVSQIVPNTTCESPRAAISAVVSSSTVPSVLLSSNRANNTVKAGESIIFTATPTNGGATPKYVWSKNGSPITGATNATYTSSALANNDVIEVEMTPNVTCSNPSLAISNQITVVVTGANSVFESYQNNGLGIFPNPVTTELNIVGMEANFDYKIIDSYGNIVKDEVSQSGKVSTSNLPSGAYVLLSNNIYFKFIKE